LYTQALLLNSCGVKNILPGADVGSRGPNVGQVTREGHPGGGAEPFLGRGSGRRAGAQEAEAAKVARPPSQATRSSAGTGGEKR
jgi:hypothetical protein